ncbi:hypothetical protein WISP_140353 [Willisornis vidua]|uniref:Uncharacterized protein n=1 Tax=Willisornis vidua TaxID=1566151 RepID=A0ABQ9CS75_9PASS|nr:hypothetical protein WISP_140353 [Willisornis vidua]
MKNKEFSSKEKYNLATETIRMLSEEQYDLILEQVRIVFKPFPKTAWQGKIPEEGNEYVQRSRLHVIQNAKMVGNASDLENADVHQGMGVDTVTKQFVLKVVGIMELAWLLGFVAVQLDGLVEHVT